MENASYQKVRSTFITYKPQTVLVYANKDIGYFVFLAETPQQQQDDNDRPIIL